MQARLQAPGVEVTRHSVNRKVTRFDALVARIGSGVNVVFLPWQIAANAQLFGQQLEETEQEGRHRRLGRLLDSGDFRNRGLVRDLVCTRHPSARGNAAFIEGYGARFVANFGPPVYAAAQAAIAAIRKACADGAATRAEVQKHLKATFIPKIVLGGNLRFTAHGDRKGAAFSIFKLGAAGAKTQVG